MRKLQIMLRSALACTLAAMAPAALYASTFVRASVDDLTLQNSTVVVGEVLDSESYWNADATFILTDVRIQISEVVKGSVAGNEVVVTLLGGTVGDLSVVIPGGAQLQTGGSYVLFLGPGNLPGARGVQTVLDHSQGIFRVAVVGDHLRAISQAAGHPLVADVRGETRTPGGIDGLLLDDLLNQIRTTHQRAQETEQ